MKKLLILMVFFFLQQTNANANVEVKCKKLYAAATNTVILTDQELENNDGELLPNECISYYKEYSDTDTLPIVNGKPAKLFLIQFFIFGTTAEERKTLAVKLHDSSPSLKTTQSIEVVAYSESETTPDVLSEHTIEATLSAREESKN